MDIIIDEFLDLYKEIEKILESRGFRHGRSSIIMQFISSPEGRRFKDELNTCREMRNILAHNPDISGEPPFVPSKASVNALKRIKNYLTSPPLALSHAVQRENIIFARLSDKAKPIMENMVKLGFSHIPVFESGLMVGVFSVSTIFSAEIGGGIVLDENTLIKDFSQYLPIDAHICESFIFAPQSTTLDEARTLLKNTSGPLNKRPAAIFITRNGDKSEKILGMVTPWDVLSENITNE